MRYCCALSGHRPRVSTEGLLYYPWPQLVCSAELLLPRSSRAAHDTASRAGHAAHDAASRAGHAAYETSSRALHAAGGRARSAAGAGLGPFLFAWFSLFIDCFNCCSYLDSYPSLSLQASRWLFKTLFGVGAVHGAESVMCAPPAPSSPPLHFAGNHLC